LARRCRWSLTDRWNCKIRHPSTIAQRKATTHDLSKSDLRVRFKELGRNRDVNLLPRLQRHYNAIAADGDYLKRDVWCIGGHNSERRGAIGGSRSLSDGCDDLAADVLEGERAVLVRDVHRNNQSALAITKSAGGTWSTELDGNERERAVNAPVVTSVVVDIEVKLTRD